MKIQTFFWILGCVFALAVWQLSSVSWAGTDSSNYITPYTTTESKISDSEITSVFKKTQKQAFEKKIGAEIHGNAVIVAVRYSRQIYAHLDPYKALHRFIELYAAETRESFAAERKNNILNITREHLTQFGEQKLVQLKARLDQIRTLIDGRALIKQKVMNQDRVVDALVDAWQEILTTPLPKKSRSVMILGTTGTGKSYAAEVLAQTFMPDHADRVLKLEGTDYMTDISATALVGAPPGYISSDNNRGRLPEFLHKNNKVPVIIIINEFEKMHKNITTRLMELFERGQISAGDGKVERPAQCLVVLTSNRGVERIFNNETRVASEEELARKAGAYTQPELKRFFTESYGHSGASNENTNAKPELVNRIDYWVVANMLPRQAVIQIARREAQEMIDAFKSEQGIQVELSEEALFWFVDQYYSIENGARSVVHAVRQNLQKILIAQWNNTQNISTHTKTKVEFEFKEQVPTLLIRDESTRQVTAELAMPVQPKIMDLNDTRFAETLRLLDSRMKSEIIGQDDLVEKIVSFTRLRTLRSKDPRPMVFGIFGLTGTGKTEVAKVYAKHFYGSSERAKIFEFGKIQNRHDLANFFNPAKGVVGSDTPSPFENLLVSFPEGGVIVFDEISNMGKAANSAAEREGLFQYFYSMLDEGKWTNEHGQVYNLARWTIIMTGNDGQELFKNAFNDDTRLNVWNYYNRRDWIKQILLSQGVPDAFVNRISVLALSRPLVAEVRRPIQDKFLSNHVYSWIREQGIELILDETFLQDAARFFFPLEDGARGNRRFVEDDLAAFLGDLISTHITAIQEAQKAGQRITIQVRMNHQIPAKTWAVPEAAMTASHASHIELVADLVGLAQGPLQTRRLIQTPTGIRLISNDQAVLTAVHEAGHALVNEHLNTPAGPLRFITIESSGNYGGYCSFDSPNRTHQQYRGDLESVIREMAVAAAGAISQEVSGISVSRDMGWRGDLDSMRKSLREALLKNGLIPGLEFASIGEKDLEFLDEETRQRVAIEVQRLGDIAIELARRVLSQPEVRHQVELLSNRLVNMPDRGYLTAGEYQSVIGPFRSDEQTRNQWLAELMGAQKSPSDCARLLENKSNSDPTK